MILKIITVFDKECCLLKKKLLNFSLKFEVYSIRGLKDNRK